ncbi:unnamed protein product [Rotaria magnacalcarata]
MTDKVDEKLKQTFLNQTQKIIISTGKFVADFQSLLKTIKQSDQYEYYQHLFKSTQVASFDEHKYEIDYLKKGQSAWEKRIVKSLNTMCSEVNLPLARQRNENEMRSVRRHWNELGHICGDLNRFRPVYSAKDFLDVICVLINPNLKIDESIWNCGLIKIPLVTKSFIEIKNLYSDLRPNLIQYCSDETFNEVKEEENIKLALQILEKKSNLNAAREYAKRGCPTSLRGKLWSSMLDVDLSNWHVTYFNYLKQNVIDYDLLVDSLYFKDVKLTAVNDDQLFVFEDYLYQAIVGLCVLFESLLRQISPDLWFHLQDIQVQPLRIAFKWMMRAFSGYLASNQLLALWDRILAYDSLEILSLLAVAIFVLRKGNVLTVTSESAVEAIFSDISSIKVIPLLQFILGH